MSSQPSQITEPAEPLLIELQVLIGRFATEGRIASVTMQAVDGTEPRALEQALRALVAGLAVALPTTTARTLEEQEDYRLILSIGAYWAQKQGRTPKVSFPDVTARQAVLKDLQSMISIAMRFHMVTGSWYPDPALPNLSKPQTQEP